MRKVSKKQVSINLELAKIKKDLPQYCCICHRYTPTPQLMHLLPRSLFPEYILEPWNLRIGCPECHVKYDNDLSFRKGQKEIIEMISQHDECAANRYFNL
jgi:hypothetical protein